MNAPATPYHCGKCGERFASKSQKNRHKATCKHETDASTALDNSCADEDRYGNMALHTDARTRFLANAEWEAMDWRGRLPADWPERKAAAEAEWSASLSPDERALMNEGWE